MRLGIIFSALLHTAVILAGIVVLPSAWEQAEKFEMIPVELLTIADLTNVIAQSEEKPPEEEIVERQKVEEKPVTQPPPPQPEPEPEPVAQDEMPPLPDPQKAKEPEPKPEPKKVENDSSFAKAQPRRKPKPPVEEKKTDELDFDQIAALLDKTPTEPEKPQPKEEDPLDEFLASLSSKNRSSVGLGNDMTMSEKDALRRHIARCWRAPAGAANPEELIVDLKMFLNRDGTLAGLPEVISVGRSSFGGNTFGRVAEDAARRAVMKCEPYDFLSDSKYESWKVVTMTFDPSKMIGK